jgi:hypothetical protein
VKSGANKQLVMHDKNGPTSTSQRPKTLGIQDGPRSLCGRNSGQWGRTWTSATETTNAAPCTRITNRRRCFSCFISWHCTNFIIKNFEDLMQINHEAEMLRREHLLEIWFLFFWGFRFFCNCLALYKFYYYCVKALIPVQITFTARVFLYRILVEDLPQKSQIYTRKKKKSQIFGLKNDTICWKKLQGHLFVPPPPSL